MDNTNNNQGNQNQNKNTGNGGGGGPNIDLSTLSSLLGGIPQVQQKKATIIDHIAPFVKMLSPKWGDVIVGILKNLELEKLLAVTKNEETLEKTVREEEAKLEKGENQK